MKVKSIDFIALDIGSSKISAVAANIDNTGLVIIESQMMQLAEGIKSSSIINQKEAESSIVSVIYALEKELNRNIKQAHVSISGSGTKSYYVYHTINLSDAQVNKKDVERLIHKALSSFKVAGQEVIHYFPIEFTLDEQTAIVDPVGMFGKQLGCKFHIVTANSVMLLNLANCLAKCQVEVASFNLAIFASGMACLTEDEKELGSLVIDIGARTTSFGVFLANRFVYSGHVPVGSWHITSDIAKALSISINSAEKLKVLYGSASENIADKYEIINLEELGIASSEHMDNFTLTTAELVSIIKPRVDEILELIKQDYDQAGVDHLISRKVVLTGGGSVLRGLKDLVGQMFNKNVRIAKLTNFEGLSDLYNPGVFASVVGMVKIFAKKQERRYALSANIDRTSIVKKIFSWLKENV